MKKSIALLALLALSACDQAEADKTAQINSMRLTEQGYDLLAKEQPGAAIMIFDQALAGDKKSIRAYQGRGIALDRLGKHAAAKDAYEKALAIDPKSVSVANNLAMSKIMQAKYEDAVKLLTPIAEANPGNKTVNDNLALANCLSGKRDEARKIYGKTLKPKQVEENLRFCDKFEIIRKKSN